MPLTLTCSKCGQKLSIADELKGKQVQCPKCQEIYLVEKRQPTKAAASKTAAPAKAASPRRPATGPPKPTRSTAAPKPQSTATGKSTAKPTSKTADDPSITVCPKCKSKMRLPVAPGVNHFMCPKCSATITVRTPEVEIPSEPLAQVSAIDDDPFADLPDAGAPAPTRSSPLSSGSAFPSAPAPAGNPYASSGGYTPPRRNSGGSAKSTGLLGPGLLIAIPYGLGTLSTLAIMGIAIVNRDEVTNPRDFNVMIVLFSGLLINFFLVLAGSIRMITGGAKWVGYVTCIAALLPTLCLAGMCLGLILYPFAIGGSIWGLVALSSQGSASSRRGGSSGPYRQSGDSGSASDYLRRAEDEMGKQPKDNTPDNSLKAIGFIIGGVVLLGIAAVGLYGMYLHFNGEAEARRPGRAIGGILFCSITGFSLLGRGLAYYMN
ncbi:hypothetical protein V7x_04930 [Crateriforma conspicua]|uniref:Uncharacterized protein n=2 Tax=Planctomycetaceae TaxID=126 RepID=A0A5C6FPY7_9PLAN|nr:hypothetical protein V7x_04930 [Crateriforma conspicua]